MKKIQLFYILKLDSDRLKDRNYKIKNLDINTARLNGELVSISDSQMVRSLYEITNRKFSELEVNNYKEQKREIQKRKNAKGNRKLLKDINLKLDEILYIPEIISIHFTNNKHYKKIIEKGGIQVNGKLYVPFIFSAGMVRRNSGLFIDSSIKDQMDSKLDNGRNKEMEIVPAKYNSYYALYSSSTFNVTFPRIAVVSDLILNKIKRVDFAAYIGRDVDPITVEQDKEIEFNLFDGCGMVSPEMARKWSQDLELDYVGSTFGVRSSFLKGMCVIFPFHKFANEVANKSLITDVYGNSIDINNVDVIVSTSMFKLWDSYSSTEEYISKCKENRLGWGISKINPKTEKNFCKTSYQFLQVLELNNEQIKNITKPTIDWLNFVSGGDISSSLLYLLGEVTDFPNGWFNRLEPVYQALLLENNLINDSFIISHLDKSISKKKNDSKKGSLLLEGNYQAIIPDLYLYECHIFGVDLIPLLNDGESYSSYWNKKNISQVACIRSPIVFESEVGILNLRNDEETEKWFGDIQSGIILPANGISMDFASYGGADSDYDLLATINSREIIEGKKNGLPIIYNTEKAPKIKIDKDSEQTLWNTQLNGFGTKVGFYTNVSSTLYAMLYNYEKDSPEYNIIMQRLKWGRCLQGLEIDKQKGLMIPSFPEHWVKWKKITDEMTDEEKEYWNINNTLLADKRPYFFIYLYPHYMRRYKKEQAIYNNISMTKYSIPFSKLLSLENKTEEQEKLVKWYKRKTFFIDNNSVMNRICHYMEESIKEIKSIKNNISSQFDPSSLYSINFKVPSKINLDKMQLLFKEYKSLKRSFRENHADFEKTGYSSIEQIAKYINRKAGSTISSNSSDLADLAVYLCYEKLGKNSKSFAWQCFGRDIVENIKQRTEKKAVRIPMPHDSGSIEYLWGRYNNYLINIED